MADDEAMRLQAVLDALPAPIFFKDTQGVYRGCNLAFARYLGMPRDRLVGKTVFDLAPADLAEVYRAADETLFKEGGTQVYEARVQWADGSRRDVVFHKAAIRDDAARVTGLAGVLIDVTEQRAAERSLRDAQRLAAVGTLAAGVAHELNNPLTFVLSNVEHAIDRLRRVRAGAPDVDGFDEALHALDDALEGAERMRVIVRDLRTMARADETSATSVEVREVLESAAHLASHEVRSRARLTWDVGDVPPVRGSAARLGQVFLNLVVNAAHAIPHGNPDAHTIHLAARAEPAGRVAITVSDTGAGIPPEDLARIFEPFFTTKPVGLGTGLGLWICQSIVAAFGGTIEVASELGRGTTFRVVLVAAGRAMGADGAPDRRDGRARRRLLVVDDEPLVAATVRRQLAAEFAVDAASGVGDALARIASGRYDAVVCDADMPGPGGLQLLDALRRDAPELARRLLFITGGEAANPVGAPSLAKPFDGRQLRRALRDLLPQGA